MAVRPCQNGGNGGLGLHLHHACGAVGRAGKFGRGGSAVAGSGAAEICCAAGRSGMLSDCRYGPTWSRSTILQTAVICRSVFGRRPSAPSTSKKGDGSTAVHDATCGVSDPGGSFLSRASWRPAGHGRVPAGSPACGSRVHGEGGAPEEADRAIEKNQLPLSFHQCAPSWGWGPTLTIRTGAQRRCSEESENRFVQLGGSVGLGGR